MNELLTKCHVVSLLCFVLTVVVGPRLLVCAGPRPCGEVVIRRMGQGRFRTGSTQGKQYLLYLSLYSQVNHRIDLRDSFLQNVLSSLGIQV